MRCRDTVESPEESPLSVAAPECLSVKNRDTVVMPDEPGSRTAFVQAGVVVTKRPWQRKRPTIMSRFRANAPHNVFGSGNHYLDK